MSDETCYTPNLDDLERMARTSTRPTVLTPETALWLVGQARKLAESERKLAEATARELAEAEAYQEARVNQMRAEEKLAESERKLVEWRFRAEKSESDYERLLDQAREEIKLLRVESERKVERLEAELEKLRAIGETSR